LLISLGGPADIDELRGLWLQMLEHHRMLVGGELPLHSEETSWQRARQEFRRWVEEESAILLLARDHGAAKLAGFAMCRLLPEGPTFALGPVRGEIDSLVVDRDARGLGVGTTLLEAIHAQLTARGIRYCSIGVLAQNQDAAGLYERVGFEPWTQNLVMRLPEVP
jgi:ribosomal protein S18 acetylase RimI-like enzyme